VADQNEAAGAGDAFRACHALKLFVLVAVFNQDGVSFYSDARL
jgi:hypothetical protein